MAAAGPDPASQLLDLLREAEAEAAADAALLRAIARQRQRQEEARTKVGGDDDGQRLFYKVVARTRPLAGGHGSRLVSIFDGATEYRIGSPTGEDATAAPGRPRFFAYSTLEEAVRCPFPSDSKLTWEETRLPGVSRDRVPFVVLLVKGVGEPEYHGRGKFSFPQLVPVAVLPRASWRDPRRWR